MRPDARTESETTLTDLRDVRLPTVPYSSSPLSVSSRASSTATLPTLPSATGVPASRFPDKNPSLNPSSDDEPAKPTRLETALCLLSAHLLLVTFFGLITSFGALQPVYRQKYSKSAVSWIGSVQSTLGFLPSFAVGLVFDRCGPRWLCVAGSLSSDSSPWSALLVSTPSPQSIPLYVSLRQFNENTKQHRHTTRDPWATRATR